MLPIEHASAQKPRIADRLASARRGRFVGRAAELELFRSALIAGEPSFSVLFLHGPGGVGKTTLLRAFASIAVDLGRTVVQVDGRNVDPSPAGFQVALRDALHLNGEPASAIVARWPLSSVLLIDTYETLTPVDAWLRETFLPQLPAEVIVVIAGRKPPMPAWRTDLDWAQITRIAPVGNLRPEESRTFLTTRGVPEDRHPDALAFTRGHPLALTLVADVLSQGDQLSSMSVSNEPDVVRVLLERLVHEVSSARHRQALEVCALVWATTETLLADVLEEPDAHDLFEWLCQLSFIEYGPHGLYPHDIAREALYADMRWRNPDGLRTLIQRLSATIHTRFELARGVDQQRIWFDVLYLVRHNPFMRPYFEWEALGSAFAEPALPRDHVAILEMVRRHQGEESERIARHWLARQPEGFLAYRNVEGELIGFMAQLALHEATEDDLRVDPAVPAALEFVRRHGPVRSGEEVIHLRFWMSRDAYQDVSPAVNLTAINSSIYWMTHPELAWNFITIADPDLYEPQFTSIQMWRSPEADFEVGGRRYGIFAHDWRKEPQKDWFGVKANLALPSDFHPEPRRPAQAAPLVVLSQAEFAEAVRQALRDYTRPDRLATNPLMSSRLVVDAATGDVLPTTLQTLLLSATASLTASPKDTKFRRAIWHTYIEPAATQELAAELLDLPFNTYRYHLAKGIERVIEWLWQRELRGADR